MLESEEFGDVVLEAVEAAARNSDDEKIRQYAAILVGWASPHAPGDLEPAAVLRALAELTPRQVALLALIQAHGLLRVHDRRDHRTPSEAQSTDRGLPVTGARFTTCWPSSNPLD